MQTVEQTAAVGQAIRVGGQSFTILFPDLLRPLTAEEREGLKEDIRKRGVLVPVVVDEGHGVIDGFNRLSIAADLGLAEVPLDVRHGLTGEQKRELAKALNEHRRHLTAEELQRLRQERVRRVAEARRDGYSLRAIAGQEGVSLGQVQRDLFAAGVSGDTPGPGGTAVDVPAAPERDLFTPAEAPEPDAVVEGDSAERVEADPAPVDGAVPAAPDRANDKVKGRDGKRYSAKRSRRQPDRPASAPSPTPFRWGELRHHGVRLRNLADDLARLAKKRVADRDPADVVTLLGKVRALADEVERGLAGAASGQEGTV